MGHWRKRARARFVGGSRRLGRFVGGFRKLETVLRGHLSPPPSPFHLSEINAPSNPLISIGDSN